MTKRWSGINIAGQSCWVVGRASSRLSGPRLQPSHHHLMRGAAAARKLLALQCLGSKAGGLRLGLPLVGWQAVPSTPE
jgi:hypothetical protein